VEFTLRWWAIALLACFPMSLDSKPNAMPDSHTQKAIELMTGFAERTGLTSQRPQKRYLWTDSFAVCNFVGLSRATGDERYRELALRLVDRVHHTLGRHRSDDPRTGWISGLSEQQGEAHPTRGGLRIGKDLPERGPDDPFDQRLEWDRDGQYFHYLTKWMHALDLVARSTRERRFNVWSRELAQRAHGAFTYRLAGGPRPRMYWKMSIDLSRPLVPSMGHHDPLDGFVTGVQLQATAKRFPDPAEGPTLGDEVADFARMIEGRDWATADPLGLGGLLMDAYRVEQLTRREEFSGGELLESLLAEVLEGLQSYAQRGELEQPAGRRLAFRELGLAIGLHAAERMSEGLERDPNPFREHPAVRARLEALERYIPLADKIESFWLVPEHRNARSWTEHRDINEVMLATSLVPRGCLVLDSP
jgi:hypothetical protein